MNYLMVLLVPFYRVNDEVIACESAFASHLKELLPRISEWGSDIVILSPVMSAETYENSKHHLTHIHSEKERIHHVEGYPVDQSRVSFFLTAPFTVWPKIWKVVKTANVVHSSESKDVLKLFTFIALLFAVIQGKKSLLVKDIDHRHSAKMSYLTGKFSRKSYWLSRYIYMPLVSMQMRFAVRFCNLLMLKGQALVDDYGKGKAHVKNFYDTVHDDSMVLSEDELSEKINVIKQNGSSLNLVYFGRVVEYKGILDMIEATILVAKNFKEQDVEKTVSLTIIGAGDQKSTLQNLVKEKDIESMVKFLEPMTYGKELLDELKKYDFLLAAPKREDTPRSVFDAMACGLPIFAYDTYYYKDLESTGAVNTVPWLSIEALASEIIDVSNDIEKRIQLVNHCRSFALNNTQEIWMNKRLAWTKEFLK